MLRPHLHRPVRSWRRCGDQSLRSSVCGLRLPCIAPALRCPPRGRVRGRRGLRTLPGNKHALGLVALGGWRQ